MLDEQAEYKLLPEQISFCTTKEREAEYFNEHEVKFRGVEGENYGKPYRHEIGTRST